MSVIDYRHNLTSMVLADKLLDEDEYSDLEENEEDEEEENEKEEEYLIDDNAYNDYYLHYELEEEIITCDGIFGCECYGECKNKPRVTKQPKIYKDQFKVLSEILNMFPLLQTLYIRDRHSDKGIEFYDKIIDRCKNLTSIDSEIRNQSIYLPY